MENNKKNKAEDGECRNTINTRHEDKLEELKIGDRRKNRGLANSQRSRDRGRWIKEKGIHTVHSIAENNLIHVAQTPLAQW